MQFVFLVFKVKQDEASQDNILSKLAFSFSATKYWFIPDAFTTVSSTSVDLYLGIHL